MIYYEVWGWDTFSSESYFCGRFISRKAAEADVNKTRRRRGERKTQVCGTPSILGIVNGVVIRPLLARFEGLLMRCFVGRIQRWR